MYGEFTKLQIHTPARVHAHTHTPANVTKQNHFKTLSTTLKLLRSSPPIPPGSGKGKVLLP